MGKRTSTTLAVLTTEQYASYLGLTLGEDPSGEDQGRLGITKVGSKHLRMLFIEAAQSYGRGAPRNKSRELKKRQKENSQEVITDA